MPSVSVIIPVYNVQKYLRQCLDSVIGQTLQDIEIICVDDGSTDDCPAILDEYAAKDNRITVIHKPNGGYGHAMNVGMDAATGEYIGIVESDDWVLPEMFQTLYETASAHRLDLVKADCLWFWEEQNYVSRIHINSMEAYYNRILNADDRLVLGKFYMNTWTVIYKRRVLQTNRIRHQETPGASYQDTGFWLQTINMAERAMWLNAAMYMHRKDNPESSVKSKGKMLAIMSEYDYAASILLDKDLIAESKICNAYRMSSHRWNFFRISNSLKPEYSHIVKEDYLRLKDDIDWSAFEDSTSIREWLEEIARDPDGFCEACVAKAEKAREQLKQADQIVLYGAGTRAKAVWNTLHNLPAYRNKVAFAAVSGKAGGQHFEGLEVRNAEEIKACKGAVLVLICVSKRKNEIAYREIVERLDQMGITGCMDTEETFLWS